MVKGKGNCFGVVVVVAQPGGGYFCFAQFAIRAQGTAIGLLP